MIKKTTGKKKRPGDYKKLAVKIAEVIGEKKAEDTIALDISSIASFTEIIMISSANSSAQINAIMRELKKNLTGIKPDHIEGEASDGWVLVDYDGLILNIFIPVKRDFYSLERLWGDGKKVNV